MSEAKKNKTGSDKNTTAAKKDDNGKADLSLIPLSALVEEAKGFMLGEGKYGRDNYKAGLEASRLVGAALRHVLAWQQGEENDPESGASHLGHARCCLAMILECQRLGTLKDNRFKGPDSTIKIEDISDSPGEMYVQTWEPFRWTTVKTDPHWQKIASDPLDYLK